MSENVSSWTEQEQAEISQRIMAALEQVIDPELGIDIVNLGLVYGVELLEEGHCVVKMTLTTMGCPLADVITEEIMKALKSVPEVQTSEVKLVWYPAWDTSKMSRYARIALGIR
ncbi:MAG: metal-sulfur cluster assembly factor [Desemzia incerta]|uniref:Metal-sulfur cluster biosynthetic enzyme n=1 Tax=Desemzia incerta TaxID=82801 RepID=A0A1I5WT47_9LACT|nr:MULTISPECIES: metal-sulfur cluster assembly factor [Desemzia]MCI3029661.1 metal-sulfur cluster assembly factor [Desemzia sp. C1]WHZ31577.1 metal-sulfur cluster assembly factor [Desemzia incerta]SFQ22914.1 Metal-sulfur cluster biosynthetic enzyme [Desemzia incerta]